MNKKIVKSFVIIWLVFFGIKPFASAASCQSNILLTDPETSVATVDANISVCDKIISDLTDQINRIKQKQKTESQTAQLSNLERRKRSFSGHKSNLASLRSKVANSFNLNKCSGSTSLTDSKIINARISACNNIINSATNTAKEKKEAKYYRDMLQNLKTNAAQMEIIKSKQNSAKYKVDNNNKKLGFVAVLNGAAAGFFGAHCSSFNFIACAMAAMSATQAASTLAQRSNNQGISNNLSGLKGFGGFIPGQSSTDSFDCPPGYSAACNSITQQPDTSLNGGSLDPKTQSQINKDLFRCPTGNCFKWEGKKWKAVKTPGGVEITASDLKTDLNNLNKSDQTTANALASSFEAKHKNLMNKVANLSGGDSSQNLPMEKYENSNETDDGDDGFLASNNEAGGTGSSGKTDTQSGQQNVDGSDESLAGGSSNKKRFRSLASQFKNGLKNTSHKKPKTVTVGDNQVGLIHDNIFLMVHRRYQERKEDGQFIEKLLKKIKGIERFLFVTGQGA